MKVAVIGSRRLWLDDLGEYLPKSTEEIVSGGAKGIDTCAKEYAEKHGIKYTEFRSDYRRFGRGALLKRNLQIIEYADRVIAVWDGKSRGTRYVVDRCSELKKPITVVLIE